MFGDYLYSLHIKHNCLSEPRASFVSLFNDEFSYVASMHYIIL